MTLCAIGATILLSVELFAQSGLVDVDPLEEFWTIEAASNLQSDAMNELLEGEDEYGRTPLEIRFLWKPGMNPDDPEVDEIDLMDMGWEERHKRVQQAILRQYVEAKEEAKRASLKSFLQRAVLEEFEDRQHSRKLELMRMENELKRLLDLHKNREQRKDRIVTGRVEQLIRDAEGLGWGAHNKTSSSD
jgi:hypothetical protein